jgi:hypothetical protein
MKRSHTAPSICILQNLDLGTTPGRSSVRSGECRGMVRRLITMFKGEHPPEALQSAASKDALQAGCVQATHTVMWLFRTPLSLLTIKHRTKLSRCSLATQECC